jgi:phospholipid transport system substrate-binding protein
MKTNKCPFVAVATFVVFVVGPVSTARSAEAPATEQIKNTVENALVVLRDPKLKPAGKNNERRELLKQVLFARFDFSEMARRALGAHWRHRTPDEQKEFVRLFTELLERAYADTIESYSDEKIVYVGEKRDGSYAEVTSKIVTSNGQEFSIGYKTQSIGGEWKVYDVVVENISMVNNFRSQFNRVINNASYEELVRRLKDKQANFGATKK